MKCKICKCKTHWDESYGPSEFIVCPKCFEEMVEHSSKSKKGYAAHNEIMSAIFTIGHQIIRTRERNGAKK